MAFLLGPVEIFEKGHCAVYSPLMKNFLLVVAASLALSSCGIQSIPKQMNEVDAAWAEVNNQYKRRSDLVPNLVQTVKGYAKHEAQTLEAVVAARAKATQVSIEAKDLTEENLKKMQQAQSELRGTLSRLLAVAENYPNLKADTQFQELQAELTGTENRITVARNRYIEQVKNFNNLVTVFPTSLTNSLIFKHEKKPQLDLGDEQQLAQPPEVKF